MKSKKNSFNKELTELSEELYNQRKSIRLNQEKNFNKIKMIRKKIARLHTNNNMVV